MAILAPEKIDGLSTEQVLEATLLDLQPHTVEFDQLPPNPETTVDYKRFFVGDNAMVGVLRMASQLTIHYANGTRTPRTALKANHTELALGYHYVAGVWQPLPLTNDDSFKLFINPEPAKSGAKHDLYTPTLWSDGGFSLEYQTLPSGKNSLNQTAIARVVGIVSTFAEARLVPIKDRR